MSKFERGDLAIVNGAVASINYYNDTPGVDWFEYEISNAGSTNRLSGHISQNRVEEFHDGRESEATELDAVLSQGLTTGLQPEYVEETAEEGEARVSGDAEQVLTPIEKARKARADKRAAAKAEVEALAAVAAKAAPEPGKTAAEAGVQLAADD